MITFQKQTNNGKQSQSIGEVANGKSKAFEQAEKEDFNSPQDKTINGDESPKKVEGKPQVTHQTAPHLQKELKVGSSNAWNESSGTDADNEQKELDKNVKRKIRITEIESEETKARRIKKASEGDTF